MDSGRGKDRTTERWINQTIIRTLGHKVMELLHTVILTCGVTALTYSVREWEELDK